MEPENMNDVAPNQNRQRILIKNVVKKCQKHMLTREYNDQTKLDFTEVN